MKNNQYLIDFTDETIKELLKENKRFHDYVVSTYLESIDDYVKEVMGIFSKDVISTFNLDDRDPYLTINYAESKEFIHNLERIQEIYGILDDCHEIQLYDIAFTSNLDEPEIDYLAESFLKDLLSNYRYTEDNIVDEFSIMIDNGYLDNLYIKDNDLSKVYSYVEKIEY